MKISEVEPTSTKATMQFARTRRVRRKNYKAKNTIRFLKKLSGRPFALAASYAAGFFGIKATYSYDDATGLYTCLQDEEHRFVDPSRIWTMFWGLRARGQRLVDEYLLDLVPFKKGDWIVDVGANTGDLVLCFKALDIPVNMIALEPSPREFSAMEINLGKSSAIVSGKAHQVAAWNKDAEGVDFFVKSDSADSSLIEIGNSTEAIKLTTCRLDSMLERRQYRLLKLEAEGAEPEILEGATGIIDCFEYVAVDVGFERGVRRESTLPEVTNFLAAHGFEIIGFHGTRYTLLFHKMERAEA